MSSTVRAFELLCAPSGQTRIIIHQLLGNIRCRNLLINHASQAPELDHGVTDLDSGYADTDPRRMQSAIAANLGRLRPTAKSSGDRFDLAHSGINVSDFQSKAGF